MSISFADRMEAICGTLGNFHTSSCLTNRVLPPILQFIRPHQLTYKVRLRTPRKPLKRATVGPGTREARHKDVFYQLGLDPLSECQNPALLAGFLSEMGKIYGREVTGLTTKNQRRLGKAIRRAKMMGVIPILSSPPDLQQKRR